MRTIAISDQQTAFSGQLFCSGWQAIAASASFFEEEIGESNSQEFRMDEEK